MKYYLTDLEKSNPAEKKGALFAVSAKKRLHLLGLGDVGGMLLSGLKLLGGEEISQIGIYNIDEIQSKRYEYEMNQITYPQDYFALPEVAIIEYEHLFDCDVFVFCASKAVPAVGSEEVDVRMVQFEANRSIITEYAKLAREKNYQGLFAVISDPVDPLCKAAYLESNTDENGIFDAQGLKPDQIKGYGLGVMNSRAAYYAKKDTRLQSFLTEGRAFGPHGNDLVIANSIEHYDDALSKELTELTITANLKTRALGFKPYIAPALSSGTISLLLTLQGKWHYSSNYLGGVYLGAKNRITDQGTEIENMPLPGALFQRIEVAWQNLRKII